MLNLFVITAQVSAFFAGILGTLLVLAHKKHAARHKVLKSTWQGPTLQIKENETGLARKLLSKMEQFDKVQKGDVIGKVLVPLSSKMRSQLHQQLLCAGLGQVRVENAHAWRVRMAAACMLFGGLVGAVFSSVMLVVGALAGAVLGWRSLSWALRMCITRRSSILERYLSEALEVICLGLRAGLSFERSLELYCERFPRHLGFELASAQQMWRTGLLSREAALRNLASTYDSQLFSRVVDSIVRALRFGSPLADNLESLAQEARRAHRARVEERVMKAPVKMMMPVGLLILPSMLLLVMGPIMLELIQGF